MVWLAVAWICNTQSGVPVCTLCRVVFSWVHLLHGSLEMGL